MKKTNNKLDNNNVHSAYKLRHRKELKARYWAEE